MRTRLETLWTEMEANDSPAGVVRRLLDPNWPGELSAAMVKPDNAPALLLEVPVGIPIDPDQLAKSDAIEVATSGDAAGVRSIQLTLIDPRFRDTFLTLSADLAERVLATSTPADGARALVHNLGRWLRFLKRRKADVLTVERQTGLYGELATLADLLADSIGFSAAVWAWTGPNGAYQDFQLGRLAIEVKTLAATQPQQLRIETERQLDDRGLDALVVAHHKVDRRRDAGRSLPDLVEYIRDGLAGDEVAREHLDDQLFEVGYLDAHAHLYAQHGYAARGDAYYRVGIGFPRIVEDDLRPGLGAVRYMIDASACSPFEIDSGQVAAWVREAPVPDDPITSDESQHLEFKASAWAAQDPNVPSKVINESTVKAIAGFLNAEGGLLVVGVEDRTRGILGIQTDLDYLDTDVDDYENRLTTLVIEAAGAAAAANVRVSFEDREGATVCLVAVRPSASPVFCDSPARKDRKGIFWARINNSTRELSAEELVTYIRTHWG
ncbi:MAG: PD-(D/E)XK motif protein [Acidimicrobiales bacterium]